MPLCRAIFEMIRIHYKLLQVSIPWLNHLKKSINTNKSAMLLYNHIKENYLTISYTPMWKENLITKRMTINEKSTIDWEGYVPM